MSQKGPGAALFPPPGLRPLRFDFSAEGDMLRALAIVGFLLAAIVASAPAQAFDSPESLVAAIYEPYKRGQSNAVPERYYTTGLRALLQSYHRATNGDETDGLGFDPFINAQSALLHDLQIGETMAHGDRAVVQVSFFNFDRPTFITLSLLREGEDWKVDDIASFGSEEHWLLSWLLRFDPWAV
jgi:hypothetical protein